MRLTRPHSGAAGPWSPPAVSSCTAGHAKLRCLVGASVTAKTFCSASDNAPQSGEFNVATLLPHIFDYPFFRFQTYIAPMPIRQYLQGHRFDAETARLLGIAFEMALVTLQQRREIEPLRAAVAQKIIELAKTGERDPERLCERALKATEPMAPVLISDPGTLPPHASPPVLPEP